MREWFQSHYMLLKDFAGPAATVIAATVAAGIAGTFARAQKNIALDKLKFDLFNHRYKIYNAAKELLECVALIGDAPKLDSSTIRALYITIDEARFFFDRDIREWLQKLAASAEAYFDALTKRHFMSDDDPKWREAGNVIAAHLTECKKLYSDLPSKFEPALRFRELQK